SDVDEGAATIARPSRLKGGEVAEEEEAAEDLAGVEEGEELVPRRREVAVAAMPEDWGVFMPSVLLVSTFFMFILGLMSFELVRGMWSYRAPTKAATPVVRAFAGIFYDSKDLPTD